LPQCRYSECHYAECRGAIFAPTTLFSHFKHFIFYFFEKKNAKSKIAASHFDGRDFKRPLKAQRPFEKRLTTAGRLFVADFGLFAKTIQSPRLPPNRPDTVFFFFFINSKVGPIS
jgi:hypothetical protein